MGRPRTIDPEAILAAARAVFLEKGVNATTAEVAKQVGVSQASIFKHFGSKQQLFLAAMHADQTREDIVRTFVERAPVVGLKEALVEVGLIGLSFARKVLPLMIVSWSNREELGQPLTLTQTHFRPFQHVARVVEVMKAEMKAGRMKTHDPWLVLRTFIGALQSYALMELILGKRGIGPQFEPEAYVRGVVDVVWEGLAPPKGGKK